MEKEFVPYEQALALKELGFDEPCFGYYTSPDGLTLEQPDGKNGQFVYFAPLYQQAFRWFRGKYGYFSSPTQSTKPSGTEYDWLITKEIDESRVFIKTIGYFPTYEEAELECLKKLIEIVKTK